MAGIGLAGPEAVVDPSSLLTDGAQLIGGQWVPAAGGETIDVINPATGEVLLRVPRSGRTMSAESVLDYTQIKTVVINA